MAKFVGNTFLSDVHNGGTPAFERSYTTVAGLLSEIGDPTTPGSGVTWTATTGPLFAVPSTAFWVAERFTISGTTSDWQRYPVQAKDGGIPFVTYAITRSSPGVPALNSAQWITDAIAGVEAFTGRDYTTQKEFGYGTVVVITYTIGSADPVKLSGRFTRSGSTDVWVAPTQFIDGDLFVDGTIASDKIQANAITTTKISADAVTATKIQIDGEIEITSDSGRIRSGDIGTGDVAGTFPINSRNITGAGFILGNDSNDSGISKLMIGSDKQALYWDGESLQATGRILAGDSIASIEGSSISTKTFLVNELPDKGVGFIENGFIASPGTNGQISVTNNTENLRYTVPFIASPDDINKHIYLSIDSTTNPFGIGETGALTSFLEVADLFTGTRLDATFYNAEGIYVQFAEDICTSVSICNDQDFCNLEDNFYGGTVDYNWSNSGLSFTPRTEGEYYFRITVVSNGSNSAGWGNDALVLSTYASAEEEYGDVTVVGGGSAVFNLTHDYQSIQNVQLTSNGSRNNIWVESTDTATKTITVGSDFDGSTYISVIGY